MRRVAKRIVPPPLGFSSAISETFQWKGSLIACLAQHFALLGCLLMWPCTGSLCASVPFTLISDAEMGRMTQRATELIDQTWQPGV